MPTDLRRSVSPVGLISAAAIALGLLVPVPTPARAAVRHRESGASQPGAEGCHPSLEATSHQITAGESVTLFGALLCPSATSAANQAVTLYQRQRGGDTPGLSIVDTATTEADGAYQLTLPVEENSIFHVSSLGTRSVRTTVKVAPAVTLSASVPSGAQLFTPGRSLRSGSQSTVTSTVTFTGTVSPADEGAVVVLQRENAVGNEEWRRIDSTQVDEQGNYSITHTFRVPGEASVRVVVHSRGHIAAASEPLSYDISRRQNPRLTIYADGPVSYGHSVTITGVAAGAAHQLVTLLARSQLDAPVAVASATTDGSGNYTFTESPQRNTFYRVTDAVAKSTALFVGVKPALSTQPLPTAVQAGQPLSFTGSVAPANAGQRVFLERQNASGIGFHVIDVGTLSAASTYSIARTFYLAGTTALRITVPGDASHEGLAGPLSKVEVMPAPASALGTEAPAQSLSSVTQDG